MNILVSGTITAVEGEAQDWEGTAYRNNKPARFRNFKLFTNCITEINNTRVENAEDVDVIMPKYNLKQYRDNYSKTSGSLYQFCKDEPRFWII